MNLYVYFLQVLAQWKTTNSQTNHNETTNGNNESKIFLNGGQAWSGARNICTEEEEEP